MIKKDASVVSIDMKDAFYSTPVDTHHQKYLKCSSNEYLKFKYMPNRYGPAIRSAIFQLYM